MRLITITLFSVIMMSSCIIPCTRWHDVRYKLGDIVVTKSGDTISLRNSSCDEENIRYFIKCKNRNDCMYYSVYQDEIERKIK